MLSTQVQQTVALRYADSRLSIDFDDFVACVTRLESLFSELLCPLAPLIPLQDSGRARQAPWGRRGTAGHAQGQRLPFLEDSTRCHVSCSPVMLAGGPGHAE